MGKTETYRQLTAGFLLILFLAFFAKTHLFTHVHVVDGVAVVHSHLHPHKDCCSDYNTADGHTHAEMDLIEVLSEYQVLAHVFSAVLSDVDFSFYRFQAAEVSKPQTEFLNLFFLRGPPIS